MPTHHRRRALVAGFTAAAVVAPAMLIAAPASALEPDTTKPVISSITPGDGSFVRGTTTFTASVVEDAISYSYLELNKGGRWLTDDTKEPGSVKYGNSPAITLDTTRWVDGAYGLKVNSVDKSGNGAEKRIAFTIDNTAPAAATNLVDGQFVSGTSDIVVTATEANPLAYHAQLYRADGTQVPEVKGYSYLPSGSTLTIPAVNWNALADGAYYLQVSVRDKADNAVSLKVKLVRDSTRPDLTILTPADGGFVKAGAPGDVALEVADASGLALVVANLYGADGTLLTTVGRANAPEGTSWSGAFPLPTTLAEGSYSIRAGANDKAGNNRTVSHGFTVDGTAPVVTIDAPGASAALRGVVTVSGTATDAGSGISEVVLHVRKATSDGFLNEVVVPVVGGAWSTTIDTAAFGDGAFGITVLGTDAVGNTNGGGSHATPLTFDNTRPSLTIDAPVAGATLVKGSLGSATASASDLGALDRVAVNLYDANGALLKSLGSTSGSSALGTTTWTGSYALPSDLAVGSYTIRASATDVAGNSQTVNSTFQVKAAPVPTTPTVPAKPTLFGLILTIVAVIVSKVFGFLGR
ncbi:MAG: Ig-like domain-containing protein [Microbacteriaceae bacterium]